MEPTLVAIDARTDERWILSVETLVAKEDWEELWALAQKSPPIWTVRILKFLNNRDWKPESHAAFYESLSKFAAACNRFDLPGPDYRRPKIMRIESNPNQPGSSGKVTTARVTADGEYVFLLDERAACLEVRMLEDLRPVELIRLDIVKAKSSAVLAVATTPCGDRVAALTYEPSRAEIAMHVYKLENGELLSQQQWRCDLSNIGLQAPRLSFSPDGTQLFTVTATNIVSVWNVSTGTLIRQIAYDENDEDGTQRKRSPYTLLPDASLGCWRKYGRWASSESPSRGLASSADGTVLAARRAVSVVVWMATESEDAARVLGCSGGEFALSPDGKMIGTIHQGTAVLHILGDVGLSGPGPSSIVLGACTDPLARIAISEDSEFLAMSMSHSNDIKVWHLPDGRFLGALPELAHEVLAEFRFTASGSVVAVTRSGVVQIWEADGNGNAWPWSRELVQITHQPPQDSSVLVMRHAQEMRRRGWLSVQECNLLDLAVALMQNRLNLDIEVDFETELPGDVFDIQIELD